MSKQTSIFYAFFSLRAIYGTDEQKNAVHGSSSLSSAEREVRFFFPDSVLEPIPIGRDGQCVCVCVCACAKLPFLVPKITQNNTIVSERRKT